MSPARRKAGGRRELTKIQNRQTILTAARQVFAEIGFGAATVRDIIRATPLASGTFYNYFKSKEEVYQAIRDEVALACGRICMTSAPGGHGGGIPLRQLSHFFRIRRRNRWIPAAPRAGPAAHGTPEVIAGFEELRDDLEGAIARGVLPAPMSMPISDGADRGRGVRDGGTHAGRRR